MQNEHLTSYCFTHGNINDFFLVLDEVVDWCLATNKNMWKKDEIDREELIKSLDQNSFVVLKNGTENVAGMILQWSDPIFWPSAKPYESGYIHKLCVSRKYAGRNISKNMIDYAIEKCKSNQVKYLRLDTGSDNTKLRELYERNGFVLIDFLETNARKYCLYELQVK